MEESEDTKNEVSAVIEITERAPSHTATSSYRPELDGLRAIAVLSVIFYHAGFTLFQGGFVGVDIFFVLSGFLMTSIITKELNHDKFKLANFYERRIRRILPMLFFTIIVSFIPARKYLVTKDYGYFVDSAFQSSIGLSNFLFAKTTKGYYDTKTDLIPLVHTWTLAVEEQFYLVIPILFLSLWKLGRGVVLTSLSALTLGSFLLTFYDKNETFKFYMIYSRFWELAMGSLAVFVSKQSKSEIASFIGIACIFCAVFGFKESMPNPSYYTFLPTIGTVLVILFTNSETKVGRILSLEPFTSIGLYSYSAYLIHQPVFSFTRIQSLTPVYNLTYIFLIIVILGLSFVSSKFIEAPFRKKDQVSFQTILSLITLYFIILACIISKNQVSNLELRIPHSFSNSCTNVVNTSVSTSTKASSPNMVYKEVPNDNLFHSTTDQELDNQCHWGHYAVVPVPHLCRMGMDKTSPPVYFLFGDSFAKAIETAFTEHDMPGMYASFSGTSCCPIMNPNGDTSGQTGICQPLRQAVYEFIKNTTSIKTLFMAAFWSQWIHYISPNIEHTVKIYAAIGVRVIIIQEPAMQPISPPQVYKNLLASGELTNNNLRKNSATRQAFNQKVKDIETVFGKFTSTRGFTYIYIYDILCDDEFCTIGTGTTPYFRDIVHLTSSAARILKKRFTRYISF
jgi:peptidoglycan/LPS O-acetylase OafA/YrhL